VHVVVPLVGPRRCAALRYQHATAKRDEAIADGIDRILAAQDEVGGAVLRFRDSAAGERPVTS